MKPTKFELFIFFALLALIAIILFSSCGTVKPTQPVHDDWGEIKAWQYGAIVEPEFEERGVYPMGEWMIYGDAITSRYNILDCFTKHIPEDDNLIEWHGYIIIDASDSLIIIKNQ